MKKLLIITAIIISISIINKDDKVIIPESSIRLRVVASSSSLKDQTIKNKISSKLIEYLASLSITSTSKEDAIDKINLNQDEIKKIIEEYEDNYKLSIGRNNFPKKEYKGVVYPAGTYDSIVVNLGNSTGINWWCCIYPPLCNINEDNVKYTTLVQEIIDNYN